ncbi:protein phosphatase 2C domain-containing protein [Actinomadura sp. J1-007]|uniref:PP2C family protein-serine/threonine phosphatase n=1 Tax=Actinomadura sp. J1-007 TaxID=2661913 RepID=UPI0028164E07|nr:protein phosphatase 2C domain-containing protein [Actinomadura sp. J1-007]
MRRDRRPDGHCWDCGTAQPSFRAHVEATAGPGAAAVSDRGLRRAVNADAMALVTAGPWTIGVVCDGVSMSPRSERAARVAAQTGAATLAARLEAGALPEDAHHRAAVRAGRAVAALAASVDAAPACTYVAATAGPQGLWCGSVGDSRAYWLPDHGPGMALTEDDTGEHDALAAWLGADAPEPEPHIRSYRPPGPGRLLLCTDGLWRYLPDPDSLRVHLTPHPSAIRATTARLSDIQPPASRPPNVRQSDDLADRTRLDGSRLASSPLGDARPDGASHPDDAGIPDGGELLDGGGLLDEARALVAHALDAGGHDNVTALLIAVPAPMARDVSGPFGPRAVPRTC